MNVVDEPLTLPKWTQSTGEELANSISHGIGVVGALIGTPVLLLAAFHHGSISFLIGTIVFTVTMLLLYLGSMLYHAWPRTRAKSVLQLLDHSAIFWLIAGTYTPFALGPLRGVWGWTMLGVIWALAVFGTFVKAIRGTSSHRKLAMALYLGMGWLALIFLRPLALAVPLSVLLWLLAGGIAYTTGVLFFVNTRLRYAHFVWHLFVLTGTGCHFAAVLTCAL
ncbi:MAG: hemolysin D [Verrucomicrobia bacterium]|nr:MAG: hemolysin D [Verrucomicrobiota bacterium]